MVWQPTNRCVRIRSHRPRRAVTLVELLIVISIVLLLASVLLPAVQKAREEGRRTVCLSNLRTIATAMVMYMQDQGDQIPWVNPHPTGNLISPFAWGGFVAPRPDTMSAMNADFVLQPVDERPFNRYLAPDARGGEIIPAYICPSDTATTIRTLPGSPNPTPIGRKAWESTGNSFAINWWWMNYYDPSGAWAIDDLYRYSPRIMQPRLGGSGSAFVVIYEAPVNAVLAGARAGGGGVQVEGWHPGWSRHSMLFLDAHAENRYADTRYPFGDGWTAWPSSSN